MSPRKAGLGRGLEALIPTEADEISESVLLQLPVDEIEPNPNQPRSRFDDVSLDELSASIKEVGIVQPIVVTQTDTGYTLVA